LNTRVLLSEDFEYKTLLKFGVRNYENEINPTYPQMAWDPKGSRIAVAYIKEGKLNLFVYDLVTRIKYNKTVLSSKIDQIQDMKYMLDSKTLLLSAVKNGHTDIYTYDVDKETLKQITNDVYDNLDASPIAFPGKTGKQASYSAATVPMQQQKQPIRFCPATTGSIFL